MWKSLVLSDNLNHTIVRCLASEFNIIYLDKISNYAALDPMNMRPSSTFYFNAECVTKIETEFKANPIDFNPASNPMNVNAVHYGNPQPTKLNYAKPNPLQSHPNPPTSNSTPPRSNFNHNCSKPKPGPSRPCYLCTYKGFDEQHFTFSDKCGVKN